MLLTENKRKRGRKGSVTFICAHRKEKKGKGDVSGSMPSLKEKKKEEICGRFLMNLGVPAKKEGRRRGKGKAAALIQAWGKVEKKKKTTIIINILYPSSSA